MTWHVFLLNITANAIDPKYTPFIVRWGWFGLAIYFPVYVIAVSPIRKWLVGSWYRADPKWTWIGRLVVLGVVYCWIADWSVTAVWNKLAPHQVVAIPPSPPLKPDVGPAPGPPADESPLPPVSSQPESHAYPWIHWTRYSDPTESGLEIWVTVGSYPELKSDSVPPYMARIHEQVSVPLFVNPKQDGWWSCLIYNEDVPWLRTGDEFNKAAQTVSWGPSHNIEAGAIIKDDNGNWLIRAVIHEPGDSWEETAVGKISRQGKLVHLTIHQRDGHKREFKEKAEPGDASFTKAELIALELPVRESSGTEMSAACKGRPYSGSGSI